MTGRAYTYDVRIWAISKYAGKRGTTYAVRWQTAGTRHRDTFGTRKLADSFRAELLSAARSGTAFDVTTGRPKAPRDSAPSSTTWFDFARQYADAKWATASPRHRKGIAEALTTVTTALVDHEVASPPAPDQLRAALNQWAFVSHGEEADQPGEVPAEHARAINWLRRASLPLELLSDPATVRVAAESLGKTLQGRPAAGSTVTRKRATLNNALEYAVEQGHLEANTLRRVKVPRPRTYDLVDRRVVVNPTQARALLGAVAGQDPALEGFFACLYYAGLRPAEARNIRRSNLLLPREGWGRATLTGSHQYAGARWSDSGQADEERALKHRSERATRRVPLHPMLVATLRRHLTQFGTGADDRLFVTRTGKAGVPLSPPYLNPVSAKTVYRAWHQARAAALTQVQAGSVLAQRPYDLRHACLSTWLNAGVAPAQVAEWAGHSVDVLLRVYAGCLDGEEAVALRRIENATSPATDHCQEPGPES